MLRLAKEPFDCVALPHRGFREAVGGSAFRPDEDAAIGEVDRVPQRGVASALAVPSGQSRERVSLPLAG
ncbi:hypothetical protein [Brucella rhizosphaerae]|uniref:Uncharacterized protein n=1 Tax=Ochrobactrum sp. SJY1 TaxID=1526653 RepID=A0A075X8R1_9HYPH|nr:hypothetical protein [Brucella rhizosphaerae]AIH15781.1 hypothetical protein [Ochrobactrum sp. SJY1]